MKKILFLAIGALFSGSLFGQSFSDDFESYKAGAYLAKSNTKWTTWANQPGSSQDVQITNVKAHGGNNSIYFTTSSSTGGPTDIVLPFGGQYNTGSFTLDMWVYVESGKTAYFNWQTDTKAGVKWAFELIMKEDGTFTVVNTDDGVLLSGTYSQGQWVDIKMDVNLNTSSWELFMDNTSKGKFTNSTDQIASMDVYSYPGCGFYVDDISFTHTSYTKPSRNAAITNIGNLTGHLAGQQIVPTVMVRNLGTSTINSFDVSLDYNSATLNKSITGVSLSSGDTMTVPFTSPLLLAPGKNDAVAKVSNVNGTAADDDNTDDNKTVSINPTVPAKGKIVIAEEATGTWCGWCPRGAVFLQMMTEKYGAFIQPIAVHNADPMVDSAYDANMKRYVSGYPSVMMDRGKVMDPSIMEADFLSKILVAPKGTIVNGAEYDATSGELKVSLTTTFNENASGNYRIACAIVEDQVSGTAALYAQHNYYAGGGSGKMGGFENLTDPVPARKMVYEHVARAILPSFAGLPKAFPTSITAGTSFTHDFVFNISKYNSSNIHIVGMLIGPSGSIDNGSSSTIEEAKTSGYVAGTPAGIFTAEKEISTLDIYPNPSMGVFEVSGFKGKGQLNVLDLSGKVLLSTSVLSDGGAVQVDPAGLKPGIYLVRLQTTEQAYTAKVILQ